MTARPSGAHPAKPDTNDATIGAPEDAAAQRLSFADLHSFGLAWFVLALSAIVTVVAWYISNAHLTSALNSRFVFKTQDVCTAIEKRMREQEVALWGGVGLFDTAGTVTRRQWRTYVRSLRLEKYLPGLQGYGYAERVERPDRQAHVDRVRAEGFPDFDIRPSGDREVYVSIIYLEPFRDRNLRAFGYDMYSESTRSEAMKRARDTGDVAVSGMVTLVQETESDIQLGFLMYLPVYRKGMPVSNVDERRAALQGFVYSPFRIKDLMQGILGKADNEIHFRIHDGELSDPLLYDSGDNYAEGHEIAEDQISGTSTLRIGGRPWTIEFRSGAGFVSRGERNQPLMVAAGGILIDVLLFLVIASLTNQRRRALSVAGRMTSELRVAKDKAEQAAVRESALRTISEQSNLQLKIANEGLLTFNRIVAHDLSAPLKRIETFIDILREDHDAVLGADGRDILVRIDRGSTHMREILNALHTYAKYGDVSIAGKTACLERVAKDALENLAGELGNARVTLDVDDICWVCGDQDLLVHVLQNLIGNSVKFCEAERPEVHVSSTAVSAGDAELTVTDNGIGISPEHADKVFDMFVRLHGDDEYEGTGTGLTVCKKIITDHGGTIHVDPDRTVGTRIVIRLKRAARANRTGDETQAA